MTPARILAAFAAFLLWALPAAAQRVDCGNGHWCPADNACLIGGLCGRVVNEPPGAVRMSNGMFCDPGWRESTVRTGSCVPPGYTECQAGGICPNELQCTAEGGCAGGPAPTGPQCGDMRCAAGRICSSRRSCMNTALLHDCGNGTLCTHAAACEMPSGCVYVSGQRTRQQRN
jgi:hypothetical protein